MKKILVNSGMLLCTLSLLGAGAVPVYASDEIVEESQTVVTSSDILQQDRVNLSRSAWDGKFTILYGVTNRDLTDSTGYIYPAGTEVAAISTNHTYYYIYFSVALVASIGAGKVPSEFVNPTGSEDIQLTGANRFEATSSFFTEVARYETLQDTTTPILLDKTTLLSSINRYSSLTQGNYSNQSWAAFKSALNNARDVLSNEISSQVVVDEAVTALTTAANQLAEIEPAPVETTTPMYRGYNPYTHEHLYTIDAKEYQNIVAAGWIGEGQAWQAPTDGTPVYRLYNPYSGEHLYTVDTNEYNFNASLGWVKEGRAFYSSEAKSIPVYRLYNPYETSFNHHYTTSVTERNMLANLGWVAEGTAFYGAN